MESAEMADWHEGSVRIKILLLYGLLQKKKPFFGQKMTLSFSCHIFTKSVSTYHN